MQRLDSPATPLRIWLTAVVGPGEEIFWRGYVQRRLTAELGGAGLALSILAYTGVHLATANLTLILAALVCGVFWALLYRIFGSLQINIVSHALWVGYCQKFYGQRYEKKRAVDDYGRRLRFTRQNPPPRPSFSVIVARHRPPLSQPPIPDTEKRTPVDAQ